MLAVDVNLGINFAEALMVLVVLEPVHSWDMFTSN